MNSMQPPASFVCLINSLTKYIAMEELLPELKDFIVNYCKQYNLAKVDPAELSTATSIDLDLAIVDIEIELFLEEFADFFCIDRTGFSWYKYGYPEGSIKVDLLRALFGNEARWVKWLANKLYQPKFRVDNLQQAIKTGRLE